MSFLSLAFHPWNFSFFPVDTFLLLGKEWQEEWPFLCYVEPSQGCPNFPPDLLPLFPSICKILRHSFRADWPLLLLDASQAIAIDLLRLLLVFPVCSSLFLTSGLWTGADNIFVAHVGWLCLLYIAKNSFSIQPLLLSIYGSYSLF